MVSSAPQLIAQPISIMWAKYFNITVIAEWCTFIAAILLLNKKTKVWRLFILLLFLVICAETTGWYLSIQLHIYGNALPFNILMIVTDTFLIWFFTNTNFLQKIKSQLYYAALFFAIFSIVNLFFFQGLWKYNSYSETLGDIMLSVICCYFLYTLLTNKEYVNLSQLDFFWLATGLLFYSLGSAILYQFSNLLERFFIETKIDIGTYINYGLNLIFDTGLIIAFICRWKTTR
jgi:hypothetical protein